MVTFASLLIIQNNQQPKDQKPQNQKMNFVQVNTQPLNEALFTGYFQEMMGKSMDDLKCTVQRMKKSRNSPSAPLFEHICRVKGLNVQLNHHILHRNLTQFKFSFGEMKVVLRQYQAACQRQKEKGITDEPQYLSICDSERKSIKEFEELKNVMTARRLWK